MRRFFQFLCLIVIIAAVALGVMNAMPRPAGAELPEKLPEVLLVNLDNPLPEDYSPELVNCFEQKRVDTLLRLTRNTEECKAVHFDFNHEKLIVEEPQTGDRFQIRSYF